MSPVGITIIRQGRFVFMNPAGHKMLGYDREEQVLGKRFVDFALKGRKALAVKAWQRMRASRHTERARYRMRLDDGRIIWIESAARPLAARGDWGIMSIFFSRRDRNFESGRGASAKRGTVSQGL